MVSIALDGHAENLLGYPVLRDSAGAVVSDVVDSIRRARPRRWLACLNPHSYVVANGSSRFRDALHAADWLVPDGSGIVLASKMLGGEIRDRITGSDVFRLVNGKLQETGGGRVFFMGSTEETLAAIRERMARDFPAVEVAGTYSPPFCQEFTEAQTAAMVAAVNAVRPDVLWVGMTAPRQEIWLHENIQRLDVRFAAAVGAVFDFFTGRVKRSHPAFQRIGLEWLPRLLREPKRLWRRTFVSAPIFLSHVALAQWMPPGWHPRYADEHHWLGPVGPR